MKISERLSLIRGKLGLTQPAAASKFNLPLGSWKSYEKGPSEPGSGALRSLAEGGININWLLTGKGAMLWHPHITINAVDEDKSDVVGDDYSDKFYEQSGGQVDQDVSEDKQALKHQDAQPASPLDTETLTYVIEGVEAALQSRRLVLDAARKAALIQLIYEYCIDTGSRKPDTVERFLKLVA